MNTIELFCGTKSFSCVAARLGHGTHTIDNQEKFNPNIVMDILDYPSIDNRFEIIWASPPCQCFSVASIGTHWTGGKKSYIPKTEKAGLGLRLLEHTIFLIANSNCKYWFIENPRGVMRKVIEPIFKKYNMDFERKTAWYCQYGDTRAKPTDIWTNLKEWQPKMCHNGNKNCHHQPAPRGAKTGTQGLKGSIERSQIPEGLFYEIFEVITHNQ